jgi:hypothetical protein
MQQIYFMHTIFRASVEDVKAFIDNFIEQIGNTFWIGKTGVKIYERKDYLFSWWFVQGTPPIFQDDEVFTSNIEVILNVTKLLGNTEVRFVISNEILFYYFSRLSYALWEEYSIADGDLLLPKLDSKPIFSSAAQYARELDIQFSWLGEALDSKIIPIKKEKRGRSNYTEQEKIDALTEWDSVDPTKSNKFLPDFLNDRFGSTNGVLNVAEGTFNSWRMRLRSKGKY